MSWKDRYKDASFRGTSFFVDSHAYSGGRRVAVHEFPGSEHSFAEDLGQKAREFAVEALVLGPDYDGQRDALRDALEQPGTGTLVHPYLGRMTVQVAAVAMRETTEQGGCARFSITFEQVGVLTVAAVPDTAGLHKAAAKLSIADSIKAFGKAVNILALPAAFVGELVQDLGNILTAAEGVVQGITGSVTALILAPSDMATALAGGLAQIQSLAGSPERAFAIYSKLWGAKSDRTAPPATTPDRQTQAAARASMTALVQQIALSQGAISIADTSFGSATQAFAMRDALLAALDDQMLTAPDALYDDLRALRAALAADVAARGTNLAQVVSYTPPATLPALAIAQLLYGDATRADDIVARNSIAIRHPGVVAGGQPLEVLSDP